MSYSNTTNEYDSRNRLIETSIYDLGQAYITEYIYDGVGNLLSQTTGNGMSTTSYEYNSNNKLTQLTDALGRKENYNYDANGNLIEKVDRNGNEHIYTYDTLNNLICHSVKTTEGKVESISYSYAPNGNKTKESNENITTEYSYDALGMLIRETDTTGTEKVYSYDAVGNKIGFELSKNGNTVMSLCYNYDKLNRLISLKESGIERVRYIYDNDSNLVEKNYDNGVQTTYDYNSANLITSMESKKGNTVISAYYYTYALDGNQLTKRDKDGELTEYDYDQAGRLKKETAQGEDTDYSYDLNGNRKTKTVVTQESTYITEYEYDNNNRLISEEIRQSTSTVPETVIEYYYDNNGNQIGKIKSSLSNLSGQEAGVGIEVLSEAYEGDCDGYGLYEYDGFNKLIKFETAGITSEYKYNADGLRISKNVNGEITNHVWDGLNMVMETTGDGEVKETYIRGRGLIKTGSGKYYIQNAHGDITQLTNGVGEIIEDYEYDAFGLEKSNTTQIYNPFRYCGEYYDISSGTYYLQARYYDPTIGRFLAEDTYRGNFNDPLTLNLYTYCGNNPIRYYDPNGHFWKEVGDGFKWIDGKIHDGASALTGATLHASDWVASNVLGIDTAAVGAFFLMMDQDTNGIYHARTDAWQQIGGYNSLYDAVFDFGTSMSASYYGFLYGGQNYRLWAWKGDYINLGAGAELGIYQQMTVAGFGTQQWGVNRDIAMKMSMSLNYQGNVIATYNPPDPQWWITSFNPNYKNVDARDLSVSFTVNFSRNTGMFDAFYNEWSGKRNTPWTFDKKNYTATLNY